jgi:amidase
MKIDGRSAVALRCALRDGELSPQAVYDHFYRTIEQGNASLRAWVRVAGAVSAPVGDARHINRYPLFGLPIGVKDVIDTFDLPTAYGSDIYLDHQPPADAACVARIRETGGVVIGKTASTEFATRRPCSTINPLNAAHTPGGSSSGSAAAVAAGTTPLAVGTQTAGSVIRPAAYCGVAALKPTFGVVSRAGVKQLSDSLDTVGFFARHVRDLALITGAVTRNGHLLEFALAPRSGAASEPRLAFCRSPQWISAEEHMQQFFDTLGRAANREFGIPTFELPPMFNGLEVATDLIIEAEAWQGFSYERSTHWDKCSPQLQELLTNGSQHSAQSIIEAQRHAELARIAFDALLHDVDCLVTPSAPGEAPRGLQDTGPATFNKIWTLLHVPAVSVPAGTGPNGLPYGLQVIARRNKDHVALAGAEVLCSMLSRLGYRTLDTETV